MRYLSCLAIACAFFGFTIASEQERIPRFTDYPARVIGGGNPFNVKTRSTPDTACFRKMLRKTARYGEHFAGHYALSYWGCGTECARIGIVDLLTGRAYVSPFAVTGVGIKTRSDSRLADFSTNASTSVRVARATGFRRQRSSSRNPRAVATSRLSVPSATPLWALR